MMKLIMIRIPILCALVFPRFSCAELPIYVDFDISCGKEEERNIRFYETLQVAGCKVGWTEPGSVFFNRLKDRFTSLFDGRIQVSEEYRIPKIIHIIWLGSPFPKKYVNWMNSWRFYHPDWTLIVWNDEMVKNLYLINRDLFESGANYGEKSDILRYELLYQFGGLYVDTDYESIKPFDAFHKCTDFYCSMMPLWGCQPGEIWLINGILGSKAGHPFLKKLINSLKHEKAAYIADRVGILKVTKEFFDYLPNDKLISVAFPPSYFFPDVIYEKPNKLEGDWRNSFKRWSKVKNETYAIHWGEGSWVKGVVDE